MFSRATPEQLATHNASALGTDYEYRVEPKDTPVQTSIYLIGSLRNSEVANIGHALRFEGYDVFDDWLAAGSRADDMWKKYETQRGHTYSEGLKGHAAKHVFEFDLKHLNRCSIGVLVLPAGKSSHLELGYMLGKGKPGFVLMDTPDRWDVMYQFATGVAFDMDELKQQLKDEVSRDE